MKFSDLLRLVLSNLGRRKGRVALTAVGVVIGTAAVLVLVSLAAGLQRSATDQLWGINDLSVIEVYPGYGDVPVADGKMGGGGGTGSPGQPKLLTPAAIAEIAALPNVEHVMINDYLQAQFVIKAGKMEGYGGITGVDTDDLEVMGVPLQSGTTRLDKGTVIVGSWVPRNFYDPTWRPGMPDPEPPDLLNQQIKVVMSRFAQDGTEVKKTVTLRVVGVFAETRGPADFNIYARLEDTNAWNEWARGVRINRNREGYGMLMVRANTPDNVLELADAINALGFSANTPQSVLEGVNSFFTILQVIFGGIGAISLLVAAIGIANTMTMAILERTREIGLMKAIGATNRDVLSIFLGEAAGIGFFGGLGGMLLGLLATSVLNVLASAYLSGQGGGMLGMGTLAAYTPAWLPLFTLIFATLVGLLSGLYPALRAATLVPVTALKYE